jgi:acetyltransferase-like isoleucine patch superfamily enzyme
MSSPPQHDTPSTDGSWIDGTLPPNVQLGVGTRIIGATAFKRYRSTRSVGLSIGQSSVMDGVHFAAGPDASITIGDNCCFTNAILLCEMEIRIGDRALIGWNATIADTDFHPLDPVARMQDAIACSPLGAGHKRPPIDCRAVVIGSDVYIGPAVTILKGVTIGDGAWIEPGSLVTRSVPAGATVRGNPAQTVPPQREPNVG